MPHSSRLTLHRFRGASPSLDCRESDEIPALTCIFVVCRAGPEVLRLPHVVEKLHEFLDWSPFWTLTKACQANLLYLVHRVIAKQALEPLDSGLRFPGVRQWQITEGLKHAVAAGNLQLVALLSKRFNGCYVSSAVVEEAAKTGKVEILQWLVTNRNDVRWTDREVAAAIRGDHFELAKWMKEKVTTASVVMLERWATTAARKGNLDMIQWVCSLSVAVNPRNAIFEAVDNGHLDAVKWIMDQPDRDERGEASFFWTMHDQEDGVVVQLQIDLYKATTGGHYGVLEWLLTHHPDKCRINGADIEAAQNGRLDIVRLFTESGIEYHPGRALNSAAAGGHLEIVKWLHFHQPEDARPGQAIDLAARNGFLDVVEWLHENTSEGCTTFAMNGAAQNDHVEVVRWLHKHRREGCTNIAMDSAAANGNLALVQWFTENRKESCSPDAMDLAAANGHLDVVKWLHDNRHEGCTVDAMNKAAANGHLDVVEWLHANRSEGCTREAMDAAAENGHLRVVEWLHSNRHEGCTTHAMDSAARNNHLDVVTLLSSNRTEGCTIRAMDNAAERGHLEMVQFLDSHRPEGCSTAAIEGAVLGGHFEVALWISQQHSEYDVADALRRCHNANRRWEFVEWVYLHDRTVFELRIVDRLLID
jgi:hypothetical protein